MKGEGIIFLTERKRGEGRESRDRGGRRHKKKKKQIRLITHDT